MSSMKYGRLSREEEKELARKCGGDVSKDIEPKSPEMEEAEDRYITWHDRGETYSAEGILGILQ